jgi:hypothetical protein
MKFVPDENHPQLPSLITFPIKKEFFFGTVAVAVRGLKTAISSKTFLE